MEKRQNLILGLLFTGLGLAAAWMARSYAGAGGTYPQVLGLLMAFLGLVIAGRAVKQASSSEPNRLTDAPVKLFLAIAACVLYVAMVVPLAPIILGMILGPMAEQSVRRALLISRGDPTDLITRPISTLLALATLAMLAWPLIKYWRKRQAIDQQKPS